MSTEQDWLFYHMRLEYDQAIADRTEAIRLNPSDSWAFANRGESYRMKGDYERAIADLTEAIRLNPKEYLPFARRGETFRLKGDYDRAIADCTEALRLNARDFWSFGVRGDCYRMKGDYDRAIADLTEAVRLGPTNFMVFANRGAAYRMKGEFDRAVADCDEASRLKPGFGGDLGKNWWQWDAARKKKYAPLTLKEFTTLIKNGTITRETLVWKTGMGKTWAKAGTMPELQGAFQPQNEHDRVIADLTEVIRLNPNDSSAFKRRGDAYRNKGNGNYHKAIDDFTEAIRLNPADTWAFARRGEAYKLNGDHDCAIADLTEAIRLNPKYAWAFACRGQTYRMKEDYDRAIADLSEAVRLDSAHSHLLKTAQEEARNKPSSSWTPGAYYCTNGSWCATPATEDELVQLVKNKSITLDTLMVRVPDSMTPIRMFSTPEEKKWLESVVNQPSGFWSRLKTGVKLAAFVGDRLLSRAGASPGMKLCVHCRMEAPLGASVCPHCRYCPDD